MKKASTEDLRIFLMEVTDEIGSAHPETRDTKISARLLQDVLTELLANREAQPVYQCRFFTTDVDGRQIGEWHGYEESNGLSLRPAQTQGEPGFSRVKSN